MNVSSTLLLSSATTADSLPVCVIVWMDMGHCVRDLEIESSKIAKSLSDWSRLLQSEQKILLKLTGR